MAITKASSNFGKINVYPPKEGEKRVEIYILIAVPVEGMRVGVAIDASASMIPPFGANIPKAFRPEGANQVDPVVKAIARFLMGFTADGKIDLIYWAVEVGGKEIEPIGSVDGERMDALEIDGPEEKAWGTGTKLLPALNYFSEEYKDAKWAFILFITDGVLEDMENVKSRCMEIGQEVVDGKRQNCKFVIIGMGPEVDEDQMEELDDMYDGTELEEDIDLWDSKKAVDMSGVQDIMEEVDFGITIPGKVRISDDQGNEVLNYADGFPQKLEFKVREDTKSVTIEIAGEEIVQPLE